MQSLGLCVFFSILDFRCVELGEALNVQSSVQKCGGSAEAYLYHPNCLSLHNEEQPVLQDL